MVNKVPFLIDQTNGLSDVTLSSLPDSTYISEEATKVARTLLKQEKNQAFPMSEKMFLLIYIHKKKIALLIINLQRNAVSLNAYRTNFNTFSVASELFRLLILPNSRLHEFSYPDSYIPSAAQVSELQESWKMFTVIGDQNIAVETTALSLGTFQQVDNKQFISDIHTNLFPNTTLTEYNNYMGSMFIMTTPFQGIAYASSSRSSEDRIDLLSPLDNEFDLFTGYGNPSLFAKNYLQQEGPATDSILMDIKIFEDVLVDQSKSLENRSTTYFSDTYTVNKTGGTSVNVQFTPNDPSTTHTYDSATKIVTGELINLQAGLSATHLATGTGRFVILKETIISEDELTKTIFCEGYIEYEGYVLIQKTYNHRYRIRFNYSFLDPDDTDIRQLLVYSFKQEDIHFVKSIWDGSVHTNPTFHKITLAADISVAVSAFPSMSASISNSLPDLPLPPAGIFGSGSDSFIRIVYINENISFSLSSSQNISYTKWTAFGKLYTTHSTNRNFSRPMSLDWEDFLSQTNYSQFSSGRPQPEITFSVYNTLFNEAFVNILNPQSYNSGQDNINFFPVYKNIFINSIINSALDLENAYKGSLGLTLDPDQAGVVTAAWNSMISSGNASPTSGNYPGVSFYETSQLGSSVADPSTYPFTLPNPLFSTAGAYREKIVNFDNNTPWVIAGITSKMEHIPEESRDVYSSIDPDVHGFETIPEDSLIIGGQSVPLGVLQNTQHAFVVKDISITGYSILPIAGTFRWCYLINKSGNKIGVCKFYYTEAIKDLVSDYYDLQNSLLGAAKTRSLDPESIDSVFNDAANLRTQLDAYFTGGMIENNFMSYQLMHLTISSPHVIVYIYTNEE